MHHPTDRITHTTAFVTPVVEHWLERRVKGEAPHLTLVTENRDLNTHVKGQAPHLTLVTENRDLNTHVKGEALTSL